MSFEKYLKSRVQHNYIKTVLNKYCMFDEIIASLSKTVVDVGAIFPTDPCS